MRKIAWIDILERDSETDDATKVIQSYPFPDVNIEGIQKLSLSELRNLIDVIDNKITKECYHTKIHFILNRWHPKNFVTIEIKNWKYGDR